MECPTCHAELARTGKFWVCPEHGNIRSDTEPAQASVVSRPQTIFISYGREDASDLAKRLAADLQERGGHKVFIDLEGIEKGGLWEVRIEQGIRTATTLAAVMTPHSLRETSVCRDEVVFALNEGKNVIPLKADPNPSLKPSLLLARRNWIDFSTGYEAGLQSLLRFLHGDTSALCPPALPTIAGVVPLDFGPEIARLTADFTGREWVNPEIDRWLSTANDRAMVIVADPGVGKSAIAAWLTQSRDDVIGIHFCTQQNSRTRDPFEFVASLVGQLQARLPGFAEVVEAKHPALRRPTAGTALRELVIEVTRALPPLDRPRLIVVDSLDESMDQHVETVLDLLVQRAADLPAWLRIVATTRPEESILHRFRTLHVFELMAECPENRADVRRYIERRLATPLLRERLAGAVAADVTAQLDVLSEGNYLYARMALDALGDRSIRVGDLHHLSPGLTKFFHDTFRKRFPDAENYERTVAPLMCALAAARGPLPFSLLHSISGESAELVRRRLHDLRSYLRIQGQGEAASYAVYHRSLKDWLSGPEAAGVYWCRTESGDRALAGVGWRVYSEGHLAAHEYFSQYLAEHLAGAQDWTKLVQLLSDLNVFDWIWERGRKYEWMRHWQTLKGQHEPGSCYTAALNDLPRNAESPRRIAYLSEIIGWFLRDMDLLSIAQPFTERALRLREDIVGKDHPDLVASIHSLAELHRAQKKFADALPLYQRALEIRIKRFGFESSEVATSLHDLAEFNHDQKRYEDALRYYRQALEIRQAVLKADDPEIADCLNDMGTLHFETGNLDEALPNYRIALRIYENAYGADHPDVAAVLHNISRIHNSQKNYDGAIAFCARALDILDRIFGPNHTKTRQCTRTLIEHYEAAGKIAAMIPLMVRLLEWRRQMFGSDSPIAERALYDLAERYRDVGDFENAAACFRQVVTIKDRTLALDSAELATSMEALAWWFCRVHDFTDSVACARRALAIREDISGPDDPEIATALNILLRCLQEKGEFVAALPFCRRTLAIRERVLRADHPDIGVSLNNLGLTLVCLNEFAEAEHHLLRSVEVNPDVPHPYYWLAQLWRKRNAPGDLEREANAWQRYLEVGATSGARRSEAIVRLKELGIVSDSFAE